MPNENEGGATYFTLVLSLSCNFYSSNFLSKATAASAILFKFSDAGGIWNECFNWPGVVSFLHGIKRTQTQGKEAF